MLICPVNALLGLAAEVQGRGCHFRTQSPVSLPPYDAPEPDGAIARGSLDDYAQRHPGAGDLSCVIEVADASLTRDRTTKPQAYAGAGIPQYLIVDLAGGRIEVYEDPNPQGPFLPLAPALDRGRRGPSLAARRRPPAGPGPAISAVAATHSGGRPPPQSPTAA